MQSRVFEFEFTLSYQKQVIVISWLLRFSLLLAQKQRENAGGSIPPISPAGSVGAKRLPPANSAPQRQGLCP